MGLQPKEVNRAADLIRTHARATSGTDTLTWFDADTDLRNALSGTYGMYAREDCDVHADARWIADMSPSLGVHLADLLDALSPARVADTNVQAARRAARAIAQEILDNALCTRMGL